jgi:hypothetical protein
LSRETQALIKATKVLHDKDNLNPDAIWQCISNDEACKKLKLAKKYSQVQLINKVKRCARDGKYPSSN